MLGMIWNYDFFSKEAFLQSKFESKWDKFSLVRRKILLRARTVCACVKNLEIFSFTLLTKNSWNQLFFVLNAQVARVAFTK